MTPALLPTFVVIAVVLGVSQAWTWPGFPEAGKTIPTMERRRRLAVTFCFLWSGHLSLFAYYVAVPWLRGLSW